MLQGRERPAIESLNVPCRALVASVGQYTSVECSPFLLFFPPHLSLGLRKCPGVDLGDLRVIFFIYLF